MHPLKLLAHLPKIRKGLLGVCCVTGVADFITSIVLLAYQLALTTGFNRVVPSLVVTSFLSFAIPVWFVYSKPYAIRLPIASSQLPKIGSTRDRVSKFTRSIMMELIALGGVAAWTLVTVADLHAETPGLIDNCGGFTICRLLLAVFSLTWLSFLFLSLSFTSLLLSTLYFSIRRHSPIPTLFTSFDQVDWIRYSGRPVDRSNTVKKLRVKQSKQNTNTVPEEQEQEEDELKAPSRSRFGGQGGQRPDSQVPVLARSIHSTMGSVSGNDSITIDWDNVESYNGFRDSIATNRTTRGEKSEQVFILVTEKEDQEEEEVNEKKVEDNLTGKAM